jgi:hypothetical protein
VIEPVMPPSDSVAYIDLKPVLPAPKGVWMAFEVPFVYKPIHFFYHKKEMLTMVDYASAGNQYCQDNLFRVWMPQPMYMNDIFPENTWNILYFGIDKRPDYFGKKKCSQQPRHDRLFVSTACCGFANLIRYTV